MKNILHLSDLHFTLDQDNTNEDYYKELLDKLLTDLKSIENAEIDTIFLTGDICYSGQADEFSIAKRKFIEPLLRSLNLSFQDIYFVPGNHDIDRTKIRLAERKLRPHLDNETVREMCDSIENNEAWPRIESYQHFSQQIKEYQTNIIYNSPLLTVRESGKNLKIHCLNSAWIAGDDEDKGNLRLLHVLEKSITTFGKGCSNIVLLHHPIDWFNEDERKTITKLIENHVDALFYGHMHEFEQSVTINFEQDITLRLQAGTLDTRTQNSGYSIILLHSHDSFKYGRVIYRKYDYDSEAYAPWFERTSNGTTDFSIDKSIIFDSAKFSQLSKKICDEAEYSSIINIGKKGEQRQKLSDIYIEPNFVRDSYIKSTHPHVSAINSFEELLNFDGLVLVTGTEQDGKTTLLKKVQIENLCNQANFNYQRVVFILNAKNNLNSKSKITKELINQYNSSDLETSFESKIKSCIKEGNALILIDNLHKSNISTRKNINKFIQENNHNSFIITSSINSSAEIIIEHSDSFKGRISSVSLGSIMRSDIRKLISSRPYLHSVFSEDEVFQNVIKLVDTTQLPHNHFVYSILLMIYEQKNNLIGILNESDIIENYIEILLHKHCMNESKSKPSYKEIIHFLGFVCSKMLFNKSLYFSEKDYLRFVLEFEDLTFNEYHHDSYIDPVLESEIIYKKSNGIYEFSNACFYYFFLAYYMTRDNKTKDYVFDGSNYLHLEKAVEYFASRESSSFSVLDFLEEKLETAKQYLETNIHQEYDINIKSIDFDDLSKLSFLDVACTAEDIENKILELKVDRDEHDKRLDKSSPLENKKNKEHNVKHIDRPYESGFEANSTLDTIELYRAELSLLSKVFRSTELLMEPSKVMRIFSNIANSYVLLAKAEMLSIDERIILPLILPKIEQKLKEEEIDDKKKDEIVEGFKSAISILRAFIPNTSQMLMSDNLSTKKPRFKNIIKQRLSETDILNEEVLLRFLILDIDKGSIKEQMNALQKMKGKTISSALFLKVLLMLNGRHDLKPIDIDVLKRTALNLLRNNRGLSSDTFNQLNGAFNSNLIIN